MNSVFPYPPLGKTVASYACYGLRFVSDISLPELPAPCGNETVQVSIARATVVLPDGVGAMAAWFDFSATGTLLHWAEVGSFHVSTDGLRISVQPAAGVGDDLLAFPLLGPVLSECLRRRGMFVLHASAVSLNGAGIALLADKGTGKSTTAASLLGAGARLLADDLVAFSPDGAAILPGFGQVKLSDAALLAVAPTDAAARSAVHAAIDKTRLLVPAHLAQHAAPVRRLYVLHRGGDGHGRIARPPAGEALPLILRFAYAARFGRAALTGDAAALHFRQAAAVAGQGAVRVLSLPEGLDRLTALHDLITCDLADGP